MAELPRRFLLPAALLVAAIAVWVIGDRLAGVDRAGSATADAGALEAPLVSVRRLPTLLTRTARETTAGDAIAELASDPGSLSCVTVLVDGEPVLDVRGGQPLVPGYAQLLLTGHVAIDVLGPDYRFETKVMAEAQPDDAGRVSASVYLVGGGDPVLMSYGYAYGFRPVRSTRTSIEALAEMVADAGVVTIDGAVVGVEQRYDTERALPGWPVEYVSAGISGPLSALQLDDGFVERPSANGGVAIASDDPAAMAASRFSDLLAGEGVSVAGTARSLAADETLPELVPLATITSPPLRSIVFQMMAVNDASAAEMLMKEIGLVGSGTASTQAGGRATQQVLANQGVDLAVAPRDGSGLDPIGALTCNDLAAVIDTIPNGHPTLDVLPTHALPGVFAGSFAEVEVMSDLRLVGGQVGDAGGFVARTVGDGPRVTIASIVNRSGGPTGGDLAYQKALLGIVDPLRASSVLETLGVGE